VVDIPFNACLTALALFFFIFNFSGGCLVVEEAFFIISFALFCAFVKCKDKKMSKGGGEGEGGSFCHHLCLFKLLSMATCPSLCSKKSKHCIKEWREKECRFLHLLRCWNS
jgi:hypothetical protein